MLIAEPTPGQSFINYIYSIYMTYVLLKYFFLSINPLIYCFLLAITIILSLEKKHLYYTRGGKQNLHVLRATKTCRYNSLRIRGPKYWNKLAYSLKIASSYPIFKSRLKEFLLNRNQ